MSNDKLIDECTDIIENKTYMYTTCAPDVLSISDKELRSGVEEVVEHVIENTRTPDTRIEEALKGLADIRLRINDRLSNREKTKYNNLFAVRDEVDKIKSILEGTHE